MILLHQEFTLSRGYKPSVIKINDIFSHLDVDLLNENNYYYYRLRE